MEGAAHQMGDQVGLEIRECQDASVKVKDGELQESFNFVRIDSL